MKLVARKLLSFTTEQLWDNLKGDFTLVFDDGEIQTNSKETIYSHYSWVFHQTYPSTPLLKRHHVQAYITKNRLSSTTHIELLERSLWDCHDSVAGSIFMTENTQKLVDDLAILAYNTSNKMYNELSTRLESSVVSLDIVDFIQAMEHPSIKAALDNVSFDQEYVDRTYKAINDTLMTSPDLKDNPLSKALKAKLIKKNQLLQCLGPRGYLTDIDSHIFPTPIIRGYTKGIRRFYDSIIESRSAAKSLYFAQTDLQNSEYFSRRLQLLDETVQNLHPGDCGSTNYLIWKVKPKVLENGKVVSDGDLKNLYGKYYLNEETGKIEVITEDHTHLEGKTIKLRSVVAGCSHPDPYGICSVCFGQLSLHVPEHTNIGQLCSSSLTQKISQSILSVKHLDGSSSVESIVLTEDEAKFLKVSPTGDGFMLADSLIGMDTSLVISPKEAQGLTDILQVKDVGELGISRISELEMVGVIVTTKEYQERTAVTVNRGKRKANLTYEMLDYIKGQGWTIDANDNYVIDLADWPIGEVMMSLPAIHYNMSDVGQQIAGLIESSIEKSKKNHKTATPETTLIELFELVKKHIHVNLAVLEVTLYGAMVVSSKHRDYRLPKTYTNMAMGVSKVIIKNRSLSAAMAYEDQPNVITDPESYERENRPSHPMDVFLCPGEAVRDYKLSLK